MPKPPLKLFISYSHKNEPLCERFVAHLAPLVRDALVELWFDRRITGGTEWAGAIDDHLRNAQVIVLLVSADFLASPYCQDKELTLALEMHAKGLARVVPVILTPSDWETSPFAKLQLYPTDGKPVVEWPSEDKGFLNAVGGIRRVVKELCGIANVVRVGRVEFAVPKPRLATLIVTGAIGALMLLGAWLWWSAYESALAAGELKLDTGSYDEARPFLERATLLNRMSSAAAGDLQAVDVNGHRNDAQSFEQSATSLLKEYPRNPYLKILEGDFHYSVGDLDPAERQYEAAVQIRPKLADGYLRLGRVADLRGDHRRAVTMFETAVRLSPGSARYHDNLADQYVKTGDFKKAVDEYEPRQSSPLAAVAIEWIDRKLGRFPDAEQNGRRSIELLNKTEVMKLAENQVPWRINSGTTSYSLASAEAKRCYAEAEFGATLFLAKKPEEKPLPAIRTACGSAWNDVRDVLNWQLGMLDSDEAREYQANLKQ